TAVVHDGFDVAAVNDALMHDRIRLVSLVATQLRRLLDAGLARPPKLRAALIGGGPVPADLVERACELGIPAMPTYGMTETCSRIRRSRTLRSSAARTRNGARPSSHSSSQTASATPSCSPTHASGSPATRSRRRSSGWTRSPGTRPEKSCAADWSDCQRAPRF